MVRQATNPVPFQKTTRTDNTAIMSSGRAGLTTPALYAPLLRGDSCSGSVTLSLDLAEMPRPLLNGVMMNVQAWFVPKSCMPQFSGYDDFLASYHGQTITALGAADREPPLFFPGTEGQGAAFKSSTFFTTLGLHLAESVSINHDLIDSYTHVWNFRAAAHSDKITKAKYVEQTGAAQAQDLLPAFWPSDWRSRMVPDYERALVIGSMDLDVTAGQMDVLGLAYDPANYPGASNWEETANGDAVSDANMASVGVDKNARTVHGYTDGYGSGLSKVWAEMAGQRIATSLADIDKARELQSFAKMRQAYQGNDINQWQNDDAIVADLMQGFVVPEDQYRRPWLLDSKRVPVGFAERHATDAANLDQSVTKGRAAVSLSINVPRQETGGMIIVTVEVLPERVDERQSDEYLYLTDPGQLPDALRDVQRVEPVDMVLNRRIDALHTQPDALYAYEPMNDVWNRNFLRLGGSFFQADPLAPNNEQRSALWMVNTVDPAFTQDHYLAPMPFPHDVFSDTLAPAFEFTASQRLSIVGLTQFGDVLAENGDDYAAITAET